MMDALQCFSGLQAYLETPVKGTSRIHIHAVVQYLYITVQYMYSTTRMNESPRRAPRALCACLCARAATRCARAAPSTCSSQGMLQDSALHQPFAAVGVLSSAVGEKYVRRRAVARESWLQFDNVGKSVMVHFVLRCGGLPTNHTVWREAATHGDVLCTDVSAAKHRKVGPTLALYHWMQHALKAYPSALFICKADDDIYAHLPDLEQTLRAIPAAEAEHAYMGHIAYWSLMQRNGTDGGTVYGFFGYQRSPMLAAHATKIRAADCGEQGSSCTGPFPLACGPFLALGRSTVRALLGAPGLYAEMHRFRKLSENDRWQRERILDDAWLGSALWRFVGSSLRLEIFSLHLLWGYFYSDSGGLVVGESLAVYHNRYKYYNRPRVLYHHARLAHCTLPIQWQLCIKQACKLRADAFTKEQRPWRIWVARAQTPQACALRAKPRVDLRNLSVLRELGIASALEAEARRGGGQPIHHLGQFLHKKE